MKNKKLFKTIFLFVSKIFHLQNWISIKYKEVASYIDIKNYRNNAKIREIKFEFIISSPPFLERASFIYLTNETNDIFLPPNSPPPFTNFPPLTSLVHVFLSLLSYRFNVQLALHVKMQRTRYECSLHCHESRENVPTYPQDVRVKHNQDSLIVARSAQLTIRPCLNVSFKEI